MARKPHPADLAHAAQIARATHYIVHFRKGPLETYQVQADTAADAHAEAAKLNAEHGKYGRRAIIYAVTPEGRSYPLPETGR